MALGLSQKRQFLALLSEYVPEEYITPDLIHEIDDLAKGL
jgi:hypothetical protein